VDPVIAWVALFRLAGALPVLRWPLAGAVIGIVTDLLDLLLFNVAVVYLGWPGFDGYQAFDKWCDQAFLLACLVAAWRHFPSLPRRVALGLYLFRLVGFAAFEAGRLPREGLLLFPNTFEFWFLAVALIARVRPGFTWTPARAAALLAGLTAAKLVQEWALHVARLFDQVTFLGALDAVWRTLTSPFRGS